MFSRDRRDREERTPNRGKNSMAPQQPRGAGSARMNEYFVPDEGIDREVIATDICQYLGNDALVRPGSYENPATRQVQRGYFITSYRNLTTPMIVDLKATSQRWLMEKENLKSSPRNNVGIEYRTSMTHMSHQYGGPTIETTTVVPQSHDDKAHVPNSYLKSLLTPFYGASRPVSDGSPDYEGGTSTIATNNPPTLPIEGYGPSYGVDSSSFRSFETARRPRIREQPTISTYGAQTQLLQTAGQSTIADSITRVGIITAGTIGTVGSIGVGSSYYTSQQANAQNEAKISWDREQARRRERLDERESALERREQVLRERESTCDERERNLQVEWGALEQEVHTRKDGIRRREDELEKTNKRYGDWGKELNKVQAETTRRENELKERSEELRMTAMKLREREDEWKRQQQQCHCRHRAFELNSNTSSRTSSTGGNEPPKPDLSTTPLETDECSTLPPTKQSSNQIQPPLSIKNEDCNPNQQNTIFSTSTASQPSTAEDKTDSQPITMIVQDTEPTTSDTAPVPSELVSSELKRQLLTDANLDLPERSLTRTSKT